MDRASTVSGNITISIPVHVIIFTNFIIKLSVFTLNDYFNCDVLSSSEVGGSSVNMM